MASSTFVPSKEALVTFAFDRGMEVAPAEACGIAMPSGEGFLVWGVENIADDPTISYEMSTDVIRAAKKDFPHAGVIIWHTHPGGKIGPSEQDLKHRVEGVPYLVVTIPSGEGVWF